MAVKLPVPPSLELSWLVSSCLSGLLSSPLARGLAVILGKRASVLNALDVSCNPRRMTFEALDYSDEKNFPVHVTTLKYVELLVSLFYLLFKGIKARRNWVLSEPASDAHSEAEREHLHAQSGNVTPRGYAVDWIYYAIETANCTSLLSMRTHLDRRWTSVPVHLLLRTLRF